MYRHTHMYEHTTDRQTHTLKHTPANIYIYRNEFVLGVLKEIRLK